MNYSELVLKEGKTILLNDEQANSVYKSLVDGVDMIDLKIDEVEHYLIPVSSIIYLGYSNEEFYNQKSI